MQFPHTCPFICPCTCPFICLCTCPQSCLYTFPYTCPYTCVCGRQSNTKAAERTNVLEMQRLQKQKQDLNRAVVIHEPVYIQIRMSTNVYEHPPIPTNVCQGPQSDLNGLSSVLSQMPKNSASPLLFYTRYKHRWPKLDRVGARPSSINYPENICKYP